jgi:predicted transcriptional regulator
MNDDAYVIRRQTMPMPGRMLRNARRRAGLTQRALAARTGIPQETIARIERGRVDPRVGTLDRLLEGAGYGVEAMPRLGIGVDRTLMRDLLALSPEDRLRWASRSDRNYIQFRRDQRVAE